MASDIISKVSRKKKSYFNSDRSWIEHDYLGYEAETGECKAVLKFITAWQGRVQPWCARRRPKPNYFSAGHCAAHLLQSG